MFNPFNPKPFLALLSLLSTTAVFANPQLNNVAHGNVSVTQSGPNMQVNQTSGQAILNWKSFNIKANEHTHFQQPQGGVALNRIDPNQGASQVYGKLSSTGQIILINASGIYFGPTARVDVGGLIATTSNISNANFLAKNYKFDQPSQNGFVINDGSIKAAEHGLVALLSTHVENNGYIQASLGNVVLATGNTFTLDFNGDRLINFSADQAATHDGKIKNTGKILADGGKVLVSAKTASQVLDNVIYMGGITQARSVAQQNGEIILMADKGNIKVTGQIDATGLSKNSKGGDIKILAKKTLLDSAFINASGDAGGGSILIAGFDLASPTNAAVIDINSCSLVKSAAFTTGIGGTVTLVADNTKIAGTLFAGGFNKETSGGQINILGNQIDIEPGALVSIRSGQGGGKITIGGNLYALNGPSDSESVAIDPFAFVDASAFDVGTAGQIEVSGIMNRISGVLLAEGLATNASGGSISINGKDIWLTPFAKVSAKSDLGNGAINIGNPFFAANSTIVLSKWSSLDASALGANGNGGSVIVGAENLTAAGDIDVSDLAAGGFGGYIELSAKTLQLSSSANIDARGDLGGGRVIIGSNYLINPEPLANTIMIANGSRIDASGIGTDGFGGQVNVFGKNVTLDSEIKAEALGTNGFGGKVTILGENLHLTNHSVIETNGDAGGGVVFVGGSFRGAGIEPLAQMTTVDTGSIINASAINNGSGGLVVVWSENTTDFGGTINAKGGNVSGDGGTVQIVGKQLLNYHGNVDVSAPNGTSGTVLFTP